MLKLHSKSESPSNIAIVKYWGKHGVQLPNNPSVSFTLSKSKTITEVTAIESDKHEITFFFHGKKEESFAKRIKSYFERISDILPFINNFSFTINSENTFPHSAGIASSASAFSALAVCLTDLAVQLNYKISNFNAFASELARLGSGSACRSIEGNVCLWGKHKEISESSDNYAIALSNIDNVFKTYNDTILLVNKDKKSVSSSVGHKLMDTNIYKEIKYKRAFENTVNIYDSLKSGDIDSFVSIVEEEALSLHSMMALSNPSFILMKPETLDIILKIRDYREKQNVPICFTLDAGPNVHLLYPDYVKTKVSEFIKSLNIETINDVVGEGARLLK